jgi:cytochrome P450
MPDLLEMHRYMTGKKHAHLSRALESSRVPDDSGRSVITDHMIFLMMAAHDTTTSSLSSLVHLLLEHPEWQERVRARPATPVTRTLVEHEKAELGAELERKLGRLVSCCDFNSMCQ